MSTAAATASSSSAGRSVGTQAEYTSVNGTRGTPNGNTMYHGDVSGVSFGSRATAARSEDLAHRMNQMAFQDDAIIAAGPSTTPVNTASNQLRTVTAIKSVEPADVDAVLLDHIVGESTATLIAVIQGKLLTMLHHQYQRGFIGGQYADINLHFRPDRQPLKLHSLIVSRSPTIAALLHHPHSQGIQDIFLPLGDYDRITDDAFVLAIGYLYSSKSLEHLTKSNAPAVLLAANLLQIRELSQLALSLCKESVVSVATPQEASFWVSFLSALSPSEQYEHDLSGALYDRLSRSLPSSLNAFNVHVTPTQQAEAQAQLQHVYAVLPFELLKSILESSNLGSGEGNSITDQTRFNLAKKCIAERKKLNSASSTGADFEETVVLAFGGASEGASNVSVVRRPKQTRKLWKVSG